MCLLPGNGFRVVDLGCMAWLHEANIFGDRQTVWLAAPTSDEANSKFTAAARIELDANNL